MVEVDRSVTLAASADEVWALVGGFDSLPDWHPAVLSCELASDDGRMTRRLKVVGNIRLVERLVRHDDASRSCRYTLSEGPLPVEGYDSTFAVHDGGGDRCVVTWRATFEPSGASEDVAREAIEGIYDSGLNALADRFGEAA